jgi:hypothetical protein
MSTSLYLAFFESLTYSRFNYRHLIPLKYLVLLIDRLEVQIFNAASGNATGAIPSAPRSSIIFFRANKKTCRDWFAHIRDKMITAAKILCDNHMIIRQAWVSLSEKEHHLNTVSIADLPDIIAGMDQTIAILGKIYQNETKTLTLNII